MHFAGPDDSDHVAMEFVEIKAGTSRLNSNERRVRDAIEASRASYRVVGLGTESTGRPELEDCFLQLEAPVTKLTAGC